MYNPQDSKYPMRIELFFELYMIHMYWGNKNIVSQQQY